MPLTHRKYLRCSTWKYLISHRHFRWSLHSYRLHCQWLSHPPHHWSWHLLLCLPCKVPCLPLHRLQRIHLRPWQAPVTHLHFWYTLQAYWSSGQIKAVTGYPSSEGHPDWRFPLPAPCCHQAVPVHPPSAFRRLQWKSCHLPSAPYMRQRKLLPWSCPPLHLHRHLLPAGSMHPPYP